MRWLLALAVLAGCSKSADEYISKSKRTEAELMLNKIVKSVKVFAITNMKFPEGTAGPVPAIDCCQDPKRKCQPDPKQWQTAPWQELDFFIEEPHFFRYSYTSDGKSFTATAIGDLDCDTNMMTYKVSGTVDKDGPKTTLIERTSED